MFATGTLVLSILGLIILIGLKWWEERTGRFLFTAMRATVGEKVHTGVSALQTRVPRALARTAAVSNRVAREFAKHFLARMLLSSEAVLERVLKDLRRVEKKSRGGEASSFLQEVADHKKQLREREDA